MADGSVLLPMNAAYFPDGSAGNAAPAVQLAKSSAGAPTPYLIQLAFDAAVEEMAFWSFRMPPDYASAPALKLQWKMASATSGNVMLDGSLAAVTDADAQDVDTNAFATVNSSGAVAVPGTAGYMKETSIALTNADSLAAGDFVVLCVARDADAAGDTAAGDLELIAASLEYVST